MNPRRAAIILSALCCLACWPSLLHAAEERERPTSAPPREGTIVAIDAGDLVLDIGSSSGVQVGTVVELWRPMRIRHPVTGKILVDRFKLGTVRLTEVRNVLSLAKVDPSAFQRQPIAGDAVVIPFVEVAKPTTSPASTTAPPREAAPTTTIVVNGDPLAKELTDMFAVLEGASPADRVRAYRGFLERHPQTRFTNVLREEIAALRKAAEPEPTAATAFAEITRLRPGEPQPYALELDPRFVGAVMHIRPRGSPGYRSIPMESAGPRYWSTTLPADAIVGADLEYFVEAVPKTGTPVAVVGTAERPKEAPIDPRPLAGKASGTLATLTLASEIASFNMKHANDYVFQTEGAFGWRLQDTGVRAVRSGFGVLRGKGGTLVDLDQLHRPPRDVGLTYGWVETELAPSKTFSLVARPIIGLREGGVTGGAQGFFRVGNDLATNLMVGGEVLGDVGLRGIVELQWKTIPRVPIVLRSEVTNQPAGFGGDIGARVLGQVGYEVARDLSVAVRGSFQGRTINHSGPGAGAGVSYQW